MLIILICIAVYGLTVFLWFIIYAYDSKNRCHTIGDVLNEMEWFLFTPILNIIISIGFIILFIIYGIGKFIWNNLKFNKIWGKFINIKIK